MKKYLLISLAALLYGCTVVYFEQPQPKNAKTLTAVPKELRGKWLYEKDTIYITEIGELGINLNTTTLKKINIDEKATYLSDSLVLKKAGKFYVLNQLDNVGWHIVVLKKEKNGDISWYLPYNYPYFGESRHLKVNKVVLGAGNPQGDTIEYKSLKNIKNIKKLGIKEIHYKGKLKIRDIKKAVVPENLIFTYKKDGSILLPLDSASSETIDFKIKIPITK